MKKIIIVTLICLSVFSCTKKEENTIENVTYTEVNLPSFMKTSLKSGNFESETVEAQIITLDENGNEITGYIRFTMPDSNDESIIKLEISDNIFELTGLDPDFLLNAETKGLLDYTESSCIASCHETFTDEDGNKISGRGWCKAQCWSTTIIAAATIIIAIIA